MAPSGPLIMPAVARHTATLIFMHGLGDTGFGWASAVEYWRRRDKLNEVKVVLPHAPNMPVTANFGMRMPSWFDLAALGDGKVESLRQNQDEAGILKTRDYVFGLIQAEIDAGIPANRIMLGGFSMGGSMGLISGLTAKVKLAGIVGLSTWLPLDSRFPALVQESDLNHDTPIFMGHGGADVLVPTALGQMSHEMLKSQGFAATMKIYPGMGHEACIPEFDDVEAFVHSCVPPKGAEGKSEL